MTSSFFTTCSIVAASVHQSGHFDALPRPQRWPHLGSRTFIRQRLTAKELCDALEEMLRLNPEWNAKTPAYADRCIVVWRDKELVCASSAE